MVNAIVNDSPWEILGHNEQQREKKNVSRVKIVSSIIPQPHKLMTALLYHEYNIRILGKIPGCIWD